MQGEQVLEHVTGVDVVSVDSNKYDGDEVGDGCK
jgi:hypothetical protein